MKFGKYLASRQLELPEYSEHFIDYKALKKLMKQLSQPAHTSNGEAGNEELAPFQIQQALKDNKASFFFRVERELEKVNLFYLEKQSNLAVTLDLLVMKKTELLEPTKVGGGNKIEGSIVNGGLHVKSNFRSSISFLNLYQNFKKINQDLTRLQEFIELNETGFSKVVKKWDKRSKSHTKELFISSAVNVQPVFYKHEINELSDLVTQSLFDLKSIMDGDYSIIDSRSHINDNSSTQTVRLITPKDNLINESSDDMSTPLNYQNSRQSSVSAMLNNDIDELYSSLVELATLKDLDTSLLDRWIERAKLITREETSSNKGLSISAKYNLSKIFTLAISNLKISDEFLKCFLEKVNYDIDFTNTNEDFNSKNLIHECCSVQFSKSEVSNHHTIINNGVKVVTPTEEVQHSRIFIMEYIMKSLPADKLQELLTSRDSYGRTCLHYASQNGRSDILDIILPAYPLTHIDLLDNESMSPLLLAIKISRFDIIKKFVERGSNCHPQNVDSKLQYYPINFACAIGNYQIIEFLLSYSKSSPSLINRQDVEGSLPLHVAAKSGHHQLIRLLIEYGADVNRKDGFNKWTPVFYSASEGHVLATLELAKMGADLNIVDADGLNVLYYCIIEGHVDVLNELISYNHGLLKNLQDSAFNDSDKMEQDSHIGSAIGLDNEDSNSDDKESDTVIGKSSSDSIPDFHLPPPILPLRRYGHNFLDEKVLIELIFPKDSEIVSFFDLGVDYNPSRITLTPNNTDILPRNIILSNDPNSKGFNSCIFQTDIESLPEFRIDLEVFPRYGTRLIAKSSLMSFSQEASSEINCMRLPLFNFRLKNIGILKFDYHIIFPFAGTPLEATKFHTYWKTSTNVMNSKSLFKMNAAGGLSPTMVLSPGGNNKALSSRFNSVLNSTGNGEGSAMSSSIVTATSLTGDYLILRVCFLNDGTPVVCPDWSIVLVDDIEVYLPNLSYQQLNNITESLFDYKKILDDLSQLTRNDLSIIRKLFRIIFLPLDVVLNCLSLDINVAFEMIYPSSYEFRNLPFIGNAKLNLNNFIDSTLNEVFKHRRTSKDYEKKSLRSFLFLSSNWIVCKILNWKQPNFPVFLVMNAISYNHGTQLFESKYPNRVPLPNTKLIADTEKNLNIIIDDSWRHETITTSIKEAVSFTLNNNLMGLVISAHLLKIVPKLTPLIKSRGMVLIAFDQGDGNDDNAIDGKQEYQSISSTTNGLMYDSILSFNLENGD